MKVFLNRDFRVVFIAAAILLVCGIVLGQVAVGLASEDYKRRMIAHDQQTAGYLARHPELGKEDIPRAFTAGKTDLDQNEGQEILDPAGYRSSVDRELIPDVKDFQHKYALPVLILSIAFSITVLAALWLFAFLQDRKLEKAGVQITAFMAGDHNVRLEDTEEDNLSMLFSAVNTMATSLTTHISKEKQNKEFLRDTISNISHQLKTPLAALEMYNEIIQAEPVENETVLTFTRKSENELERMEYLIRSLLKLARLDAGSITLEKRNINLKMLMERSLMAFHTRAELEDKSLALVCSADINLNCDEEWLLEAVSNIVKNALDHTGSKGRVEIQCSETPLVVGITIEDNGAGIHPEDIHHVFKRFYRSRFSKDKQGIGIGLSLSKTIMEKHGGSISVESEPGRGTAFHLVFPKLTNL